MTHAESLLPSSPRSTAAANALSGLALIGLLAIAAACSSKDGASPSTEQGGESNSSGSAGQAATEPSGGTQTSGGSKADGGSPPSGGTQASAGTATGEAGAAEGEAGSVGLGAAGAGSTGPGPGGAGLGAADGITGTFGGKAHVALFSALHVPQQTSTSVIGATTAMYPPYESWRIRFTAKLGTQTCSGETTPDDSAIDFGSLTDFNAGGTTANKTCTINITSLAPKFEGTFTATLATGGGDVVVTEGAFRVPL